MRAVVQRVSRSKVIVGSSTVAERGPGLLVLLGVGKDDTQEDAEYLAQKIAGLRIFEDAERKMNLSVMDMKFEVMAVSQFTLYGDCRKGKRPSFTDAAPPDLGQRLFDLFVEKLRELSVPTSTGKFGAKMQVHIVNDGPVTVLLDSQRVF